MDVLLSNKLTGSRAEHTRGGGSARCAAAVLAVVIATPVAILLQGRIDEGAFAVFIITVVFATWFGGIGPGLIATGLAAVSLDFFVLQPRYHLEPAHVEHLLRLATFVVVSLMIGALYNVAQSARERAEGLLRSEAEARADLEHTAEELRAANAIKDEFLGLVSHELKTPLTTIVLDAGMLRRRADQLDEEMRTLMAREIGEEAERLARIIDNLLVLAHGGEVTTEPVLLGRLVKRIVAKHQARYADRVIAIDIAPGIVVTAEPLHVEQVMLNLLSNAEKYSPATAAVRVSVGRGQGVAEVSVADHGAGIDDAEADKIFSAFYRSASTAATQPGIGVGLAVCKRLVEAQSGHIWVRRSADGGAEFSFTLPLDTDAATPLVT